MAYKKGLGKGTQVSVVRESREQIAKEIADKVSKDPTVQIRTKAFALEVAEYWKSIHPPLDEHGDFGSQSHTHSGGAYRDSIHVERRPEMAFKKLPQYQVVTRIWYAHFIEFGTGPDKDGESPRTVKRGPGNYGFGAPNGFATVTRNTTTKEYAPAGKTAHHFKGTPDYTEVDAPFGALVDKYGVAIQSGTEHLPDSHL